MSNKKNEVIATFAILIVFVGFLIFIVNNFKQEAGLDIVNEEQLITKVADNKFEVTVGGEQVEIGKNAENSSEPADVIPSAKLNRFDGEVSLDVGYVEEGKKYEVVNQGDKVVWKTDTHEVRFYPLNIKPPVNHNEQSLKEDLRTFYLGTTAAVKRLISMGRGLGSSKAEAAGLKKLNFVSLGSIDLYEMPSIYESLKGTSEPTIVYYLPNEDGFGFYGYRELERDLVEADIEIPVVRYRTEDAHTCPVTYLDKDSLMFVHLYDAQVSEDPERYFEVFENAIKKVLSKYDIEFKRNGHFLYYMEGLKVKQIGRMSNDGDSMNYYMYLDSPLEDKFLKATREYISMRDQKILPLSGLREKNPQITSKISEEIIEEIANGLDYDLVVGDLNEGELTKISEIKKLQKLPKWLGRGFRNDVPENPEGGNDEKFEIELILNKKPDTNVFSFDIETEGLNFYYQPFLTEEERAEGNTYREENIEGSYAVYYKDQENLIKSVEDANKFKVGKAFHIYRPLVKDSQGKEVWGILNVEEKLGVLTVTVPQEFLENAVYPVSVDPTFGYTEVGASNSTTEGYTVRGSLFQLETGSGLANSLHVYTITPTTGIGIAGAVYKHSDGSRAAITELQELFNNWNTIPVSSSQNLETGQGYVLVFMSTETGMKVPSYYYDVGDVDQGHYINSSGLADPVTFSHDDRKYSIYATYGEVISSVNVGGVKMKGVKIY